MNKQLLLIGTGVFIAAALLVGVLWGWVSALAFVIALSLFALLVLAKSASLKTYPWSLLTETVSDDHLSWREVHHSRRT